ncbi:uncharacterized protein [Bombus fervidus]|uniref:uncharacterized protein n=1 Tax=Bombus fervidus TaxID=203811 RepID=UPI003D18B0FA
MAQGKLKVKAKLPSTVKGKDKKKKSLGIQRRNNAPIQPKKKKFEETHKLKQMITKSVNKAVEDELRERVLEGKRSLTKNEAVALKKK